MTLYEKIKSIYPDIEESSFIADREGNSDIILQNDGNGDYIKAWNHPTLTKPTQAELDAVTE